MEGFKQNFDNYLKDSDENKEFKDKRYYLKEETQENILSVQEEKQILINMMHKLLAKVDSNESISFSEHAKTVEIRNGVMTRIVKGNYTQELDVGDIMVAGMNGFDLKLDPSIDRATKKQFILQETKRRIKDLYNKQIILAEAENQSARIGDGAVKAYRDIEKRQKIKTYEGEQSGILAEQIVESFMTKLIANNPQLPFTIEMADVYDDVRSKMDFILHIKKEFTQGVKIEADAGIQFTLNTEKTLWTDVQAKKESQIEKSKAYMNKLDKKPVDNIVLVTVPLNNLKESIDQWKNQGKKRSIAGPAEHLDTKTQKLIFIKMLEKLPPELEINPEELWNSIHNNDESPSNYAIAA